MPIGKRPPPPDGTARLVLNGLSQTHPWASILWLQLTASAPAVADLQSIVDSISGLWNTDIAPQVPSGVSLSEVQAVWKTTGGVETVAQNSTVRTGTLSATLVQDASACFVVNWHLSAFYRGGHPHTFMPGVYTAAVSNGSDLNSSYQAALQTAWLAFLNGVNALTHGAITQTLLGTVSFASGKNWRTPPIFRPYTGVSIGNKIGTQRRRIGR
jgi:hypothetical protein